jgi:hypothetical protein
VNQTNKINNHQQEHWAIHRKERTNLKVPNNTTQKEKFKSEKNKKQGSYNNINIR